MKQSRSDKSVTLEVLAHDGMTEIFLIDNAFKRIASGVGSLQAVVPPGIYKIRYRSGKSQHDDLIEVTADKSKLTIQGPVIHFSAISPISGSENSNESHSQAAVQKSHQVEKAFGSGSQILIFVRDLVPQRTKKAWERVSLHTLEGTLLAKLNPTKTGNAYQFAAVNFEVNPGTYRLRVDTTPMGVYEMFLVACPGWQTQVFGMISNLQARDGAIRTLLLKDSVIMMSRAHEGFNPDSNYARLSELAVVGLSSGRNIATADMMNKLLHGKFRSPMLGIYAAHLLLGKRRPNRELINKVIVNMENLIGPHPDLNALKLKIGVEGDANPPLKFLTPPMLRKSWEIISEHSMRKISLVPAGSVTDLVSDGLLTSGCWLLSRLTHGMTKVESRLNLAKTQRMLEHLIDYTQTAEGKSALVEAQTKLNPLEQTLISSAIHAGSPMKAADGSIMMGKAAFQNKKISLNAVMKGFNVPSSSIARSAGSLWNKLDLPDLE